MSRASHARSRHATDLIDSRIHQDCHRTHSSESISHPASHSWICLSAIGRCLKDQYDAVMPPIPPRLATLVEQLKMQK